MLSQRIWLAFPYAALLVLAAWFYRLAGDFQYARQGNNLGPDFWPRAVLAAIMIICVVQGARLLLAGRAPDKPSIGAVEEDDEAPRSNLLLAAGFALTVAYGALVTVLGFLIATFAFLVLFMYAGNYRSHATIWLSGLIGTLLLTFLFQKVVYVSLPRGVPPFDRLADTLLALF